MAGSKGPWAGVDSEEAGRQHLRRIDPVIARLVDEHDRLHARGLSRRKVATLKALGALLASGALSDERIALNSLTPNANLPHQGRAIRP